MLGDLDACQYCAYRSVCQFDELCQENRKNVLVKLSDDEVMAKMKEKGRGHDGLVDQATRSD